MISKQFCFSVILPKKIKKYSFIHFNLLLIFLFFCFSLYFQLLILFCKLFSLFSSSLSCFKDVRSKNSAEIKDSFYSREIIRKRFKSVFAEREQCIPNICFNQNQLSTYKQLCFISSVVVCVKSASIS